MESRKANLFIVGAMKAGTTSFSEVLMKHPAIYTSPVKEPHYFVDGLPNSLYEPSRFFDLSKYFDKEFPNPLHITKVENDQHYAKIFSLVGVEKYLPDFSTAYLHAPESARLIQRYNPEAHIIILLRNPLKRAHSHYKMNLGKGREKRSFEDAMKVEIELYHQDNLSVFGYLGMSLYDKAVTRYKELFPNVKVISLESLLSNRQEELSRLAYFLDISPFSELDTIHKNEAKTLRFQKLFYLLKQLGLKDYFSRLLGTKFRQRLFRWFSSYKKNPIELSASTQKELEAIFNKESSI